MIPQTWTLTPRRPSCLHDSGALTGAQIGSSTTTVYRHLNTNDKNS
jgi:hypothetical protein